MLNPNLHLNPQLGSSQVDKLATRAGFGEGLVIAGERDTNVVALTADLAESTKVIEFAKKFPERFIECGVAEQNMMGVAAGMALTGKVPFVASYATFSPGRNWDQLRVSVCYSEANVKIVGAHTGVSVGPDGATHQALEDLALTRVLPNLTVVVPIDAEQAKRATITAAVTPGPLYLRLTREPTPVVTTAETPFELGQAQILKEGKDVAIIGSGPVLYQGLMAALELEREGISVLVVNNHTIKPIDAATIVWAAKLTGAVVTLEEHQVMAGAGSAVAEVLAREHPVPVEFVGMANRFGESGDPEALLRKFGMDATTVKSAVIKALKRK